MVFPAKRQKPSLCCSPKLNAVIMYRSSKQECRQFAARVQLASKPCRILLLLNHTKSTIIHVKTGVYASCTNLWRISHKDRNKALVSTFSSCECGMVYSVADSDAVWRIASLAEWDEATPWRETAPIDLTLLQPWVGTLALPDPLGSLRFFCVGPLGVAVPLPLVMIPPPADSRLCTCLLVCCNLGQSMCEQTWRRSLQHPRTCS